MGKHECFRKWTVVLKIVDISYIVPMRKRQEGVLLPSREAVRLLFWLRRIDRRL